MQLKIQRSQRMAGVLKNTVVFALDVRADYNSEERDNINKYKLGAMTVYNSEAAKKHAAALQQSEGLGKALMHRALLGMSLNVTVGSLQKGHHIECKDLAELLDAEDTLRDAAKNLTVWLDAAATFNGTETVVEYVNGMEKVHLTQDAPPLIQ
jgi:hypothetical protein